MGRILSAVGVVAAALSGRSDGVTPQKFAEMTFDFLDVEMGNLEFEDCVKWEAVPECKKVADTIKVARSPLEYGELVKTAVICEETLFKSGAENVDCRVRFEGKFVLPAKKCNGKPTFFLGFSPGPANAMEIKDYHVYMSSPNDDPKWFSGPLNGRSNQFKGVNQKTFNERCTELWSRDEFVAKMRKDTLKPITMTVNTPKTKYKTLHAIRIDDTRLFGGIASIWPEGKTVPDDAVFGIVLEKLRSSALPKKKPKKKTTTTTKATTTTTKSTATTSTTKSTKSTTTPTKSTQSSSTTTPSTKSTTTTCTDYPEEKTTTSTSTTTKSPAKNKDDDDKGRSNFEFVYDAVNGAEGSLFGGVAASLSLLLGVAALANI